jgi:sugar phosphate isomerase/epimerase
MQFGICMPMDRSAKLRDAGWDYLEALVHQLLQGTTPNEQWNGRAIAAAAGLSIAAANQLLPGSMKVTGPAVDFERLQQYMRVITRRAAEIGIKTLVFGSGVARNVPEGFNRNEARRQILDFVKMSAPLCARHDLVLVAEPLNRGECNIINSLSEAMEYVRSVDHPHFQCLLDSYHFWLEDEPLENLADAMPWIRHVHVADKLGRSAPGESGASDYRPLFETLKRGGYDGPITVETLDPERIDAIPDGARRVLEFLKRQWADS